MKSVYESKIEGNSNREKPPTGSVEQMNIGERVDV